MKILFISHFPLTNSDSGEYTTNLAMSLTQMGHECAIVYPENMDKCEEIDNIEVFPVFFKNDIKREDQLNFNYPCFNDHINSKFNFLDMSRKERSEYQEAFYRKIIEAIYFFQPDIIHSQQLWTLSGISSVLAEIYGLPLVVTSHGPDLQGINREHDKGIEWGTVWAHEAYDYASKIISTSNDNKEQLEKEFGKDNKVELIEDNSITKIENVYKKLLNSKEKTK